MAKKVPIRRRHRRLPPKCRAILLCEKVIKDAFSGTITIVGVLTRVGIDGFPGHTSPFFVFAQLAEGLGHQQLWVKVTDNSNGKTIARSAPMGMSFNDVGEVRDIIFQVPPVPLEHPGSYTVSVLSGEKEIDKQYFDTPPEGRHGGRGNDD